MDVRLVTEQGVEDRPPEELASLLRRETGLVWVDIPNCDDDGARVLSEVFGFHPLAIRDCVERNRVPKVHGYGDHVLVVLHAPELGQRGHVHYLELDQLIGRNYLVTVHGPINPAVDQEVALRETRAVYARIAAGRFRPGSAFELSHAIVSALARNQEAFVEVMTRDVWQLEQRVTGGDVGDPEGFINELFRARHGLLAVRTMAALSGAIYGRMGGLTRIPPGGLALVADTADQFDRVRAVADGEKEYSRASSSSTRPSSRSTPRWWVRHRTSRSSASPRRATRRTKRSRRSPHGRRSSSRRPSSARYTA